MANDSSSPPQDELSERDLFVLVVLAAVGGTDGAGIEDLAQAVLDADKAAGSSASVVHSPPWYGLDVPLRRLEDRGLVEIDVEMASPVPSGSSAPVADDYFVAVTHEGRRAVEAGLQ
jgi:hypothetical protein